MTKAPRLNLNGAAAQVAAAFGLTVRFRETLEPTSGRVEIVWTLNPAAREAEWLRLELFCVPPVWNVEGAAGWAAWVSLIDARGIAVFTRHFVDFGDKLAGKAASPLARARFCEWAALQLPGSRSAALLKAG